MFDEEGNAVDRTIRLTKAPTAFAEMSTSSSTASSGTAGAKQTSGMNEVTTARIDEHAQRVKERLDKSRAEDAAVEKERIRQKRLQWKLSIGNNREAKGAGEGVATLANPDEEEDEEEDEGSDGSNSVSDDDASGSQNGRNQSCLDT